MRIGIIDADLLYRKRHRFPNLACMKLSAYWKEQGFETELLLDYSQAGEYDRLYVSKVFTDTFVPEHILTRETTIYGGTGFFYDKAPVLPEAIEHHTPDYHLYDQMVKENSAGEKKKKEFQFYTERSYAFWTIIFLPAQSGKKSFPVSWKQAGGFSSGKGWICELCRKGRWNFWHLANWIMV